MLSPEWAGVIAVARTVAPPPAFTVSEWADAKRILDRAGSATPGRWRTDREPWQRGIMDALHEGAENVVCMKAGQIGVTECLLNMIGFHIEHDPCGMLLVEPSEALAKRLSRGRLAHMLRATPALARVVTTGARDAGQTLLQKLFPGGSLLLAGANSPTALASDPLRLVLFDERDKYPPHLGDEGDPVALGMKRTETFWNRRHLHVSTPTTKGTSGIEAWYQQSDQRRYYVPCPSCGEAFTFRWACVVWDGDDPTTARWQCPNCASEIADLERPAMLARGEWRSTAAFTFPCPAADCGQPIRLHRGEVGRADAPVYCEACETRVEPADLPRLAPVRPDGVIGFHAWSALKSTSPLRRIVAGFLRAQALGREVLREWTNQTLGEPFEDEPPVEPAALMARLEPLLVPHEGTPRLPAGVLVLTAGVDTQDDRLEWRLWGWGLGEERWLIDLRTLPGDPDNSGVWGLLDDAREQRWTHRYGHILAPGAIAIDSAGHKTDAVYEYIRTHPHARCYATIGRDGQRAIFTPGIRPSRGRRAEKRRVPLYVVGIDSAKQNWQDALRNEQPGPTYVHLPEHPAIADEIVQLTSERKVFRRGTPRWEKLRPSIRNEGLDCGVLALWALRALVGGGTTEALLRDLARKHPEPPPNAAQAAAATVAPTPTPARRPWVAPQRTWLRR